MVQDQFLAHRHPHILDEEYRMDLAKCEDNARGLAELSDMGVIPTLVGNFSVGKDRYSKLKDALAQIRIERSQNEPT